MAGYTASTRDFTFVGPTRAFNWKGLMPALNIQNISYLVFLALAVALVGFIVLQNLAPFGATATYTLSESEKEYLSPLGPTDRVKETKVDGVTAYQQIENLIYFTTAMPYHFDEATVKIAIKNHDPTQEVKVGYKDQGIWHYDTKVIHAPLLTATNWETVGNDPTLYQRKKTYDSVDDFYEKASAQTLVGTYQYDDTDLYTTLPNYQPAKKETVITTPIRGGFTMYVYLDNEPFTMTFERQDMNWYKDADTMDISVYRAAELVHEASLVDDGITDASRKNLGTKAVTVKNPGPELPESGVYKVVVRTTADSITTKIKTNLHKIVFAGPLFLAGNAEVYKNAVKKTTPTNLYTDALLLDVSTAHAAGLQRITSGDKVLRLTGLQETGQIIPPEPVSTVTIPKNDVTINGLAGYFAFEKSQYFQPTKFKVLPITQEAHLALVDYVLSSVKPAEEQNGWYVTEQSFDLANAVTDEGRLSWLIQAPGLSEKQGELFIKDIEMTMEKESRL